MTVNKIESSCGYCEGIMSKRFTAIEKWEDPWFFSLSNNNRLLWQFLLDKCDHAGIWDTNWPLAEMYLRFKPDPTILGDRIVPLQNGRTFIPKFLDFQYPGGLYPKNQVHASAIRILEKQVPNGSWVTLIRPIGGSKDKDKDKDKEKDKDKNILQSRPRNDPFGVFMDWYLAEVEGIRREKFPGDPEWKAAVGAGYSRYGKAVRDIIAFAGKDVGKAKDGTRAIGLWLQEKGLSWCADTVAKWFNEWARDPKGFGKNGKN